MCQTLMGSMDQHTRKYDTFMKKAHFKVHGRGLARKCAQRLPPASHLLYEVVFKTVEYNASFDWKTVDNVLLESSVYRGNTVFVFACALRRMGLDMPALSKVMKQVRLYHVRKHSAYETFARECAHSLSLESSFSYLCPPDCEKSYAFPCLWHTLDCAMRSMYKDTNGNAVYFLKVGEDT